MPKSPEGYLISSVILNGDFKTAVARGVSAEMFRDFEDEWTWCEGYYRRHKKSPTKAAFVEKFPRFRLLRVDDTPHFVDRLKEHYAKVSLVEAMSEAAGYLAEGDLDRVVSLLSAKTIKIAAGMGFVGDTDIFTDFGDVLAEVEARVKRVEEFGIAGIPTGMQTYDKHTGGLSQGSLTIVGARLGHGKALTNTTGVLTPTGYRPIGELILGDLVIGSGGKPTKVIGVYPQGIKQVCEVRFNDGSLINACEDHLWNVRTGAKPWKVQTTSQIAKHLESHGQSPAVPQLSAPVVFSNRQQGYNYDPYRMGLLLGDGCFRGKSVTFTTEDPELARALGERITAWADGHTYHVGLIRRVVEKMGLWGRLSHEKFIPPAYLTSRASERLALLQGLFDTDGSATGDGNVEYTTVSPMLRDGVKHLVETLGGYVRVQKRSGTLNSVRHRMSYRLRCVLPPDMQPFRLQRKLAKWKPRTKYLPVRTITSVKRTDRYEPMTCIAVEAVDSLFVTENGIVTHNSWVLQKMSQYAAVKGYTARMPETAVA